MAEPTDETKKVLTPTEMLDEVLRQFELAPRENKPAIAENLYYLLRLWASLTIYIIEPFTPAKRMNAAGEKEEGGEGGGESGQGILYADFIGLDNGWKIYDYGFALAVSKGEHYGSFATGDYIKACKAMVGILKDRGVTRVVLEGLDVGRFAAWCECERADIHVDNFTPTMVDDERRLRIENLLTTFMQSREKLQM